ncbi:diaminopimelate epimerase [Gloeobacter violaceus]|uniref:Diaminopimelate epimerase n=1 Tax=Gloeobacter violaceus (strain ATCC 29082 / PCC 7421) TaxID=251221 RepID=Q7NMF1_GLOVI|nr:diaminopimelate epimerase [Gloeobacter violaceus]BAC88756.1 diaminopimelate epimerase [Gloeobacter violaceus PCC 7421]
MTFAPGTLSFVKYEGLGNDFVLIDNRTAAEPVLSAEEAAAVCDRHFGVGADGVIFLLSAETGADFRMRIYNNDGSEAQMCGNGIRCLAHFARELGMGGTGSGYRVETGAGLLNIDLLADGRVRVDMGPPHLLADEIPTTLAPADQKAVAASIPVGGVDWRVTCVNMGNPHAVVFVDELATVDLHRFGPLFERDRHFPERVNTHFAEVISPTHLRVKAWERGAGPTLACGTGACAVLVAAVLNGLSHTEATVELPGGPIEIRWDGATNHLLMTGPARKVFSGLL